MKNLALLAVLAVSVWMVGCAGETKKPEPTPAPVTGPEGTAPETKTDEMPAEGEAAPEAETKPEEAAPETKSEEEAAPAAESTEEAKPEEAKPEEEKTEE